MGVAANGGGSLKRNQLPGAAAVRLRLQYLLCAMLLLACWTAARADNKRFTIAPAPQWVQPLAPESAAEPPEEQVTRGVHYLLVDQQTRVEAMERTSYRHIATKALNAQGVESIANIEIRFDPSFQKLTLHAINVRRGARLITKLDASAVRLLQRETELESLIFDGSVTASAFLEDVRVGDVVEYAYSVRGHNPVFAQKQFGNFDLQWGVPVAHMRARLLWPQGRELELLRLNGAPAPVERTLATHRDLQWDLRDIAARQVENDAPAWFDPYPAVHWGEFKDWPAVVRWALPLYRLPEQTAPRVREEIARIAAQHASPEARLLAALRFVQREVRYLGIEIGPGSHAPSTPGVVLGRRFGDCKDKTLLTIALLRGLGIDAVPALVNTGARQGIGSWLPSPGAFNHVLVRARLGGADYWLDPTRAPQEGGISQVVQADYGLALVIDERSNGLVPMAGDKARGHKREVRAVIDASAGFDEPVKYTVTTVLQGPAADAMRSTLATQSRGNLQKQYVNFYAGYYQGLQAESPMEVADDVANNRLTLNERYVIKDFWQRAEKHKRLEASIETPDLRSYLDAPRNLVRTSPLSLLHPLDLLHVTQVHLPGQWDIKPSKLQVDDPAFVFERSGSMSGGTLTLTDRLQSRRDHIAAADVGRYSSNLEKVRQGIWYQLNYNDEAPTTAQPTGAGGSSLHWLPAVVSTLALVGALALAVRVYRWDPAPGAAWSRPCPMSPNGLGGWLVLVAIGLVLQLFRLLKAMMDQAPSLKADTWNLLTTPGSEAYHALWEPAMLFSMAANLALFVGYALLLVLFFKRRSSVPRLFITLTVTSWAAVMLDTVLCLLIPAAASQITSKDWGELFRAVFFGSIWIAYFLRSERVQNTFVRRLQEDTPTPPEWRRTEPQLADLRSF